MRNIVACLIIVVFLSVSAFAQTASTASPAPSVDVFDLGNRTVKIPAPDGFVEISSLFKSVAARVRSTEDPGNDALAVHVPEAFTSTLKYSEDIDLEVYTKVSVNKEARSLDATGPIFEAVAAELEKNFGTYLEPDGTFMKSVERNTGKGLSDLIGHEVGVKISGSKPLGFFEKTGNVFSGMSLVDVEIYGRKISVLGTLSILRVNQRLVFVYAYKMRPSTDDVATLRDFAKKWNAKILAANS